MSGEVAMLDKSNKSEGVAAEQFVLRVNERKAVIGIIGLGYVGLPLAYTFLQNNFNVIGFDLDASKLEAIFEGRSYMRHFSDSKMQEMTNSGRLDVTSDMDRLAEPDVLLICVPTPLSLYREPDLSYVISIVKEIGLRLRPGQLVVLESTTYPGTCDEVILPMLEEISGLSGDSDFGVAYSPEREDPGNAHYETGNIPKVVGATSKAALQMALAVYDAAVDEIVPVSDARTAEAIKLTENIFRLVNIGLVNELKGIFSGMGIDIWEVIDAAKTKPFGFMPFYPGPGIGGHCIPIDPFYLTWKARADGNPTRFIELAGEINEAMPRRVVESLARALSEHRQKALNGSKILLLGIAYKANIDDMRESPALILWKDLEQRGAEVIYHDPFVQEVPHTHEYDEYTGRTSENLTPEILEDVEAVLIATHHSSVDYKLVLKHAPLIIDTRNVLAPFAKGYEHKIVKA